MILIFLQLSKIVKMDYQGEFELACGNGALITAQELYRSGYVDIHANNEEAFRWACRHMSS